MPLARMFLTAIPVVLSTYIVLFGDWEMDTIIGKDGIIALVGRTSKELFMA